MTTQSEANSCSNRQWNVWSDEEIGFISQRFEEAQGVKQKVRPEEMEHSNLSGVNTHSNGTWHPRMCKNILGVRMCASVFQRHSDIEPHDGRTSDTGNAEVAERGTDTVQQGAELGPSTFMRNRRERTQEELVCTLNAVLRKSANHARGRLSAGIVVPAHNSIDRSISTSTLHKGETRLLKKTTVSSHT